MICRHCQAACRDNEKCVYCGSINKPVETLCGICNKVLGAALNGWQHNTSCSYSDSLRRIDEALASAEAWRARAERETRLLRKCEVVLKSLWIGASPPDPTAAFKMELLGEINEALAQAARPDDAKKDAAQAQIAELERAIDTSQKLRVELSDRMQAAEKRAADAERESMQQFEQAREMCRQRNGETRKLEAAEARAERLQDWALRAKWYLDANCRGSRGADQLRDEMDALVTSAPDAGKCTCAAIMRADETRHFRGCPMREVYPDHPAADAGKEHLP